jgi:hypothetical protein
MHERVVHNTTTTSLRFAGVVNGDVDGVVVKLIGRGRK